MTPDTNMVERVARALWDLDQSRIVSRPVFFVDTNAVMFGDEWSGKMVPWGHVVGPNVVAGVAEEWREAARAAISAVRVPTSAMIEAAWADALAEDAVLCSKHTYSHAGVATCECLCHRKR